MPELTDPDGKPLDAEGSSVNTEFARAMAAEAPGEETAAPPRRAAKPAAEPSKRRGRPPKAERARVESGPAKAPSAALSDDERRSGVQGICQIGAGLLALGSKVTNSPALKADAVVVASSSEEIAEACVQTARHDAKFAAVIDKIAASGPYAALIGVMFSVGSQCLRNHKPDAKLPGTVNPAEILRRAEEAEQAQFAEQQEATSGAPAAA